jgi:hypothetical protein
MVVMRTRIKGDNQPFAFHETVFLLKPRKNALVDLHIEKAQNSP